MSLDFKLTQGYSCGKGMVYIHFQNHLVSGNHRLKVDEVTRLPSCFDYVLLVFLRLPNPMSRVEPVT